MTRAFSERDDLSTNQAPPLVPVAEETIRVRIVFATMLALIAASGITWLESLVPSVAALCGSIIFLLLAAGKDFKLLKAKIIPFWTSLILWVTLSALMSHDAIGLTRALAGVGQLAVTIVLGLCIAQIAQPREFRRALGWFGVVTAVSAFAVAAVAPSVGLVIDEYETGALRGLFIHRNILGFVLVASLAAQLYSIKHSKGLQRAGWAVGALLSLIAILAARSSTALIMLAFLFAAIIVVAVLSRTTSALRAILAVLVFAGASAALLVALRSLERVTAALGRDVTFSGRTKIWEAVWTAIKEKPVFGYGWHNVWGPDSSLGNEIRRFVGFEEATHAHNGYLDLWLQGGLVLLILFLIALGHSALKLYTALPDFREARWLITTLLVLLASNLTESRFTRVLGILLVTIIWYYATEVLRAHKKSGQPSETESHAPTV